MKFIALKLCLIAALLMLFNAQGHAALMTQGEYAVQSDYQTLVNQFVRDDAEQLNTGDIDGAIALALTRYSSDKPLSAVEDIVSNGTTLQPLPDGWQTGFSLLTNLEYPIGNAPATYLDPQHYRLYSEPTGLRLQTDNIINAGQLFRASYTIRHTLDVLSTTVPDGHKLPLASFAAAILCDDLAAFYSGQGDSTIQADTVNHGDKAKKYSTRAAELRKRYFNILGVQPKKNIGHTAYADWDNNLQHGGDRIIHSRRYR